MCYNFCNNLSSAGVRGIGFFDVVNVCGLIFTVIMAVPHIIYYKRTKCSKKNIENRAMVYIDNVGKYCGAFLMSINIGILEKGFTSELMENFWFIATTALIIIYLIAWIIFFKTEKKSLAYILSVIASIVLMLSGLLQVKTLLLTAGIVYLAGDLYVVRKI